MKQFFLSLLFACFITITYSQDFNVGIRGGVDFSRVSNTGTDTKFGGYAGIFVPVKLSEKFTLQPEYTYIAQGADGSYGVPQTPYVDGNGQVINPPDEIRDIKGRSYYHSLGIYNKYLFRPRFAFGLGISLDLKTHKSTDFDGTNDIALSAGVEYKTFNGFVLEIRLKKGFNDAVEPHSVITENFDVGENNYNIVGQIGIAYVFNIRKAAGPTAE